MSTRAKLLGALAAFLAVGAGVAAAASKTITANLDSDTALERVVPQEFCESADGTLHVPQPACAEDQLSRHRIEIDDTCAGAPYRKEISSVQDFVFKLRVTEADGSTRRPEIFFDMRSGATGRVGDIRVVRYDDRPGAACPVASVLFRYPSRRTLGPIPRKARGRDSFSASLANYSRHFRGKEIRLAESYVDANDPYCCPSFGRISYFRFSRARGLYVRYRMRVKRLKR